MNDLAFSHPNKQLCVITCGDDKTIKVSLWLSKMSLVFINGEVDTFYNLVFILKVWDAATGTKQFTFEGHEAPVYSVCPHYKENIQVENQLQNLC